MMGTAKHIGRVGALAVALGVGNVRRTATRMTVSIGAAAVVVMATVVPVSTASASSPGCKPTDVTCALVMGFTSLPTPDKVYIDAVGNQFIAPTHPTQPGQEIGYVPVTTPEEGWPLTGLIRLGCAAVGAQSLCGPGGAAWPDEPWWKLSGLFDLTYDQSNQVGLADLEAAMAEHPSDHLVIYGYSQGATIANLEKQRLAELYPAGTTPPDIDFVLGGDPNLPNGGLEARFPGLYIPILDWSFNGPEPTDTPFDTVVITRQYDPLADFPLYPLNFIADLNAILGFFYVHLNGFDVSLADDGSAPAVSTDPTGDTTYYFFETEDLPLFGPLRTLGVPESLIDVVEPFFREIVELGYDRSIPPGEPTPARLIPVHDPATVVGDLLDAIGGGINNAAALIGSTTPLSIPTGVTVDQEAAVEQLASGPESTVETVSRDDTIGEAINNAAALRGSPPPRTPAPVTADQGEAVEQRGTALDTTLKWISRNVGDGISQVLPAVGSPLPKARAVIGNGRTTIGSAGDRGSSEPTARRERRTSVRDAVIKASSDLNNTVTAVSDRIKQSLGGGQDDVGSENNGEDDAE